MSGMRYTICFGLPIFCKNESLHVAIDTTTEYKMGWGNGDYDVKMVFSEIIGLICMGGSSFYSCDSQCNYFNVCTHFP